MPVTQVVDELIRPWQARSYSPGWRATEIVDHLLRYAERIDTIPVAFLDDQTGGPRVRAWDELGFVNLFQGRDTSQIDGQPFYWGDRNVPAELEPEDAAIQVHYVKRRDSGETALTLAVKLGDQQVLRKVGTT